MKFSSHLFYETHTRKSVHIIKCIDNKKIQNIFCFVQILIYIISIMRDYALLMSLICNIVLLYDI